MMLVRSSSTPILGSLLPSYSDSPNHGNHSEFNSPKHTPKKLSFHQTHTSPLNLIPPSSSFSKSSPSINADLTSDGSRGSRTNNNIKRAQSEGNLKGLLEASCDSFDEFSHSIPTKKLPPKPRGPSLKSIPSFSLGKSKKQYEDDEEEESGDEAEEKEEEISENLSLEKTIAFMNNMGLQERYVHFQEENEHMPPKMHLAKGLGVFTGGGGYNRGGGGSGGHDDYKRKGFGDDSNDNTSMAEYYKRMVQENPGNPLFLRNYAKFLHKSKDLQGAEANYSRAILIDPGDGEVLSLYAELIWELHRDEERALSYFKRAVQASPENSHVVAAYAGFLWETEEEHLCTLPVKHQRDAVVASRT